MIAFDVNVMTFTIAADAAIRAQRERGQTLSSSGWQLFVPVTVIEELE